MQLTSSGPPRGTPDEGDIAAGDVRLGFTRGGTGPYPVVLLHGWPQTSYAWRRVIPLLGVDHSVLALDLRGVGRSSTTRHGFDKATMAGNVRAALANLGVERPVLVGHGIGALVGYMFARRYAADLRGLVIVDTPVPGLAGWEETAASSASWHLGFHREVNRGRALAEALVDGRQAVYFRSFIDRFAAHPDAISDDDVAVYAQGYQGPQRLAAGFAMFRTLPVDVIEAKTHRGEFTVPILAAFGEFSHATVLDAVAGGLRQAGAAEVRTAVLRDSGHWPAEEQPASLAELIGNFAGSVCAA
jgi:pimeloyl-ACP methyl ester carboxylesterase